MVKCPFDKIVYHKPCQYRTDKRIDSVIGFDTETYKDGTPFLFCTSTGSVWYREDIPAALFDRTYRNTQFGVWNLKFDSGSLLYHLPPENKTELREQTKTAYGDFKYRYIPHKMLRITKGKNSVTFWDINTFFKMSLDNAAFKYLGKRKFALGTKTFTSDYYKKNRLKIIKYCKRDADLVKLLYDYLYAGLIKLDIYPKALYSEASLSYHYFSNNTKIITVWRYWEHYRELIKYACESYGGGKFEIYRRGRFNGVSYDINSAYPYELANLIDISKATCYKSKEYDRDAVYGFLRVEISNPHGLHIPCAVKFGTLNIYPAGTFNVTITKGEYDYMLSVGIKIKILSAWWMLVETKRRPYHSIVMDLYKKKQSFKGVDKRMYHIVKVMLNGFYGKTIQLIEYPDGDYHAGAGFNPVYAAVITANTRIRICDVCNRLKGKVYAVHTDSVICKDTIPRNLQGVHLGQWNKEDEGDGLLIASGVYQIADKNRFRGLEITDTLTWFDHLKKYNNESIIPIPQTVVLSWVSANVRGKDYLANRFLYGFKDINLNCDNKRLWPGKATAKIIRESHQNSVPHLLTGGTVLYK